MGKTTGETSCFFTFLNYFFMILRLKEVSKILSFFITIPDESGKSAPSDRRLLGG